MKPSQRLIINAATISIIVLLGFGLGPFGGGEIKAAQRPQKSSLHLTQTATTVKKATKQVVIPNLVGKTKTAAESALKKIGLKIGKTHYTTAGKAKPGTVVKQSPTARVRASKGSRVDIWILKKKATRKPKTSKRSHTALSPNLHKKSQRLLLEFPSEVRSVEIYNARGQVIQRFKRGRRFDITQSLKKTRAGRIRVGFVQKSGGIPQPPSPTRDKRIYADFRLNRFRDLAAGSMFLTDSSTIEGGEPANNTIHGATTVNGGRYSGEVGATADADDFLKLTTGAGGFGTFVSVRVVSGNVRLFLYDPVKSYLDGYANKVWIALRPGTTFYFQVSPTGSTATLYTISIYTKTIMDPYETNDTFSQAKSLSGQRSFLGNVMNSSGDYVGINDWYKIHWTVAQNLHLEVTGAGLATGDRVLIYIYDPANQLIVSNEGGSDPINVTTNDRSVLRVDLREMYWPAWPDPRMTFPPGDWRMLVTNQTAGAGSPVPYGTGDAPRCYTQPTGYWRRGTRIP
jgi:hypothetical protein